MRLSRQNVLLLVLLTLLGVLAWQQLRPAPTRTVAPASTRTPAGTPPRASSSPRPAATSPVSSALPAAPSVHLAALTAERDPPVENGRNPFRFERAAPVVDPLAATVPTRVPTAASDPAAPPTRPSEGVASAAPARTPAAPITLKFIGLVQKGDGETLAVLSPGDEQRPLYGREGDIIEGRYRIIRIGSASVDIEYADGRERQTLRLSGQ